MARKKANDLTGQEGLDAAQEPTRLPRKLKKDVRKHQTEDTQELEAISKEAIRKRSEEAAQTYDRFTEDTIKKTEEKMPALSELETKRTTFRSQQAESSDKKVEAESKDEEISKVTADYPIALDEPTAEHPAVSKTSALEQARKEVEEAANKTPVDEGQSEEDVKKMITEEGPSKKLPGAQILKPATSPRIEKPEPKEPAEKEKKEPLMARWFKRGKKKQK